MSEKTLIRLIKLAGFIQIIAPFALIALGVLIFWLCTHLKIGWH